MKDYLLSEFRNFVTDEYYGTDMTVVVVESKEPYYVMASSSGSSGTKLVLKNNASQPCPDNDYPLNPICEIVRIPVNELSGNPMDVIIQRTFATQKDLNFPTNELVTVKENTKVGSKAYITQVNPYKQLKANNLEWYTFVIMPYVILNNPGNVFILFIQILLTGTYFCFFPLSILSRICV